MPTYICEICKFSTKIRKHLETHHNTKKHKINEQKYGINSEKSSTIIAEMSTTIAENSTKEHKSYKEYGCEFCNKTLKTKANLTRHQKYYCKSYIPPSDMDVMHEKIKNFESLLEDQKKQHDKEKKMLFKLLDVENNTGMKLTENYAIYPAASVAGFYFASPHSQYFGVGKISRDQIEDYAIRKNMTKKEVEKWLATNLDYNP